MNSQMELFHEDDDFDRASRYFDANPDLLRAFERAAVVMQRRTGKVSARGMMEFARWLRNIGDDGMREMLEAFRGVRVHGDDVAAMPNAYSPYVTRHLEGLGFNVTKARSKMDDRL